jgi:Ca2+-binding RTX toxin-like protein
VDMLDLDDEFNLAFSRDIADSTMVPHVTVNAAGNGAYHLYYVSLSAGATLTADIDNTTGGLNSYILIRNEDVVASNDDSLPTQGAGGSASNLDSFVSYTSTNGGTYIVMVMQANGLVPVALGQNYQLHISAAEIPPAGTELSNDTLFGDSGNDTLWGGGGDDVLDGGADADVMRGGSGKDFFVFSTALGAANVDQILDFNAADDTMRLDHTIFTALGVGALAASAFKDNALAPRDADDHIIYNSDTGSLFYDADGLGGATAVKFASLLPGLALTAADFVVI